MVLYMNAQPNSDIALSILSLSAAVQSGDQISITGSVSRLVEDVLAKLEGEDLARAKRLIGSVLDGMK